MELLCRCPRRNRLVSWPEDVDGRLEVLVRAAAAAGEQTSRSQLLAALVAAADTRPAAIADLLHSYRRLAADALTEGNQGNGLPVVPSPGPHRTQP
ncbi:hypothetical protein OG784_42300 [Streptomyces sp. NBC_01617]|uniref:hypothetical protein n=1 Tax=Streptomyces sp. NBC_01617 TaxID=2975899 RepID=UPI00386C7B68|nr:hypothetical protein OG784_00045 [Streptomyces sp. NBC_01617]WTE64813.1 hypothetical protein OG784_42300 [Streptomyces sp. NBC_01617]